MIRMNQGGSVASFIVVAALLVIGTAGILYYVKRAEAPVTITPQVAVSDKKKTQSSGTHNAQKVDETESSTTMKNQNTSSNQKNTQQTSSDSTATQPVTELSHTGPADTIAQAFMVGILAAALVAYLQSRKQAVIVPSSL